MKPLHSKSILGLCLAICMLTGCSATGMYVAANMLKAPVSMYLQVVDQYDQPVAGAKVKVLIAGMGAMALGEGGGDLVSDSQGLIHVRGSGRDVYIESVSHPNFSRFGLFSSKGAPSTPYIGTFGLTSSGQNAEGAWTDHISSDKPFKIHVWRAEAFEAVKVEDLSMRIPVNDGTYYFEPGRSEGYKVLKATKVKSADSLLAFNCQRVDKTFEDWIHYPVEEMMPYDVESWKLTITAPGGGVLEQVVEDKYSNLAPAGGYRKSLIFQSDADKITEKYDHDIYSSNGYKRVYFTLPERSLYGAFYLFVGTFGNDGTFCQINGDIKYLTNGSRNLSYQKCKGCSRGF